MRRGVFLLQQVPDGSAELLRRGNIADGTLRPVTLCQTRTSRRFSARAKSALATASVAYSFFISYFFQTLDNVFPKHPAQ
jgi:hypothetical protein